MALSFASPVSADFSLREFAARGEENPDGWGLAWFPEGGRSVAVVKEPVKWGVSSTAGFLATNPTLSSRIHLAHVRHKTVGDAPNHADTHPFARELDGRDYVFAHNGTLSGPAWDLPLGRFQPVGATDSERFFCHLLGELAERPEALQTEADWSWLHAKLAASNTMGKLNVLLSDGQRLFVYHDVNAWKGLNFRRVRVHEGQPRHFDDADLALDLTVAQGRSQTNAGFVVATRPAQPDRLELIPPRRTARLRRWPGRLLQPPRHSIRRVHPIRPEPGAGLIETRWNQRNPPPIPPMVRSRGSMSS